MGPFHFTTKLFVLIRPVGLCLEKVSSGADTSTQNREDKRNWLSPFLTMFSRARMLHSNQRKAVFQRRNETENQYHRPAAAFTSPIVALVVRGKAN